MLARDHPARLNTINDLAEVYWSQGRNDQARPLFTGALEARRRVLGETHPDTLTTMNDLAALYFAQGKYQPAERLFTEALEVKRRVLGEAHPDTLGGMNNLATVYQIQAKPEEAERLYAKVLEVQRRVLDDNHPDTLTTMDNLALTYLSGRKYVDAEIVLRDIVRTFERTAPDSWRRFNSQSLLGTSIAGQGKYVEAEPQLVSAYEGLLARQPAMPAENRSVLTEAGQRIVQLYQTWGKPEKAAEWMEKLQRGPTFQFRE